MGYAVVLLSGGVDSTTALYLASMRHSGIAAVSFDYKQHHRRELEQAKRIADAAGASHITIPFSYSPASALTDGSGDSSSVPDTTYSQIEGKSPSYVPFRNGMLISMGAAYAVEQGAEALYVAAHAEDAANWAYADCTPAFVGAMSAAVLIGTYNEVMVRAPFLEYNKPEIVRLGAELGVPYELTYSCYRGGELHCGACPTCHARHTAFVVAEVDDPTVYASKPRVDL